MMLETAAIADFDESRRLSEQLCSTNGGD